MSPQDGINSTLTRVQAFAIVALMVLLVCGGLALGLLSKISEQPAAPILTRGIETSWPSEFGKNRLWSFCAPGEDSKEWIADHIAAITVAQGLMPPKERK